MDADKAATESSISPELVLGQGADLATRSPHHRRFINPSPNCAVLGDRHRNRCTNKCDRLVPPPSSVKCKQDVTNSIQFLLWQFNIYQLFGSLGQRHKENQRKIFEVLRAHGNKFSRRNNVISSFTQVVMWSKYASHAPAISHTVPSQA